MLEASDTGRAVLDATLAILAEDGPAAVSVVAVRARAGVSNGSVYHHFGTRDGILRAALLEAFASLVGELENALDERDAETGVRELVARHLAWVGAHRGAAAVLYLAPLSSSADHALDGAVAGTEELAGPVAAWFRSRTGRGDLRAVPAWAIDPVVLAPVHEVARRWLVARSPDAAPDPDTVATVADAVRAVVRPRPCG